MLAIYKLIYPIPSPNLLSLYALCLQRAKYKSYVFLFNPAAKGFGMADSPGGSYENGGDGGDRSPPSSVREQDRFLPIANIGRIMKKALPANGKISKDAKDTVQECVSEFISFITSEASDRCLKERRKTINGDDLLWAMATLGFEDYIGPLKVYLARYREVSEGETKVPSRSADGSSKNDTNRTQLGSDAQFAHQASFSQGFSFSNPQIEY
ncbi:Nuclear transcription factor Y subunit B-8 [Striga hermonthica]|uniref:Nuclear transcription factor Y subunit B-8 n=1 Tax=Striga hermonthica TaxID=68872 RepID=A0A9N7NGY4_STRHE|nr:Nuclear transcription factor Y subunit B-8 [Striga hermonthica]